MCRAQKKDKEQFYGLREKKDTSEDVPNVRTKRKLRRIGKKLNFWKRKEVRKPGGGKITEFSAREKRTQGEG